MYVATFEDSGKCKGYAWVEFETGFLDGGDERMVKLPPLERAVRGLRTRKSLRTKRKGLGREKTQQSSKAKEMVGK
jgi:hypothetical protein